MITIRFTSSSSHSSDGTSARPSHIYQWSQLHGFGNAITQSIGANCTYMEKTQFCFFLRTTQLIWSAYFWKEKEKRKISGPSFLRGDERMASPCTGTPKETCKGDREAPAVGENSIADAFYFHIILRSVLCVFKRNTNACYNWKLADPNSVMQ